MTAGTAGGGVFINCNCRIDFIESVVHSNHAGYGGGMSIYSQGAQVMCKSTHFFDNHGGYTAGAILVAYGTLTMDECDVFRNRAGDTSTLAAGGGIMLQGQGTKLEMASCNVYDNWAKNGGGFTIGGTDNSLIVTIRDTVVRNNIGLYQGGGLTIAGSTTTLDNVRIEGNTARRGGGVDVTGPPIVTARGSTITQNMAAIEGGGLYNAGGLLTLTKTLISGNLVGPAGKGANVQPVAGLLYYAFPLVPGHWLPNSECRVNRDACSPNDLIDNPPKCSITRAACALASGAAENGWQPTVMVAHDYMDDGGTQHNNVTFQCRPPSNIQPCDWKTEACVNRAGGCLLGRAIYVAPFLPIETSFPNPCVAGYIGSSAPAEQTSAQCAGKCPAGCA